MKKILIIICMTFCLSLAGCGEATILNVRVDGDIQDDSPGMINICDRPLRLVYDSMTRIVYIENRTYNGYYIYTPYYAPNGLPYKYNIETNAFEEITNQN